MVQKRKTDLDIMRILAIIGVITIHSLGKWADIKTISVIWNYSTYAVPLFVMISGAVWLEKEREISIKKIWTKNIFHIVIAFSFWSVVYACIYHSDLVSIKDFIWRCIIGNYHLWYCYMIIGIYILLPIIMLIKKNDELYRYLIILVFCCTIALPALAEFQTTSSIQHILDLLALSIGNEYLFYFLIGNMLYEKECSKYIKCLIYLWGTLSVVLIFARYLSNGDASFAQMGYTVFIFVLVKDICKKCGTLNQKIALPCEKIAKMCFGIYLVHDIFLYVYNEFMIIDFMNPYILALGKIIFCFITSYIAVFLIKKIPILGKYIV